MADDENLTLVQKVCDVMTRRDIATLGQLIAPDAVQHMPGRNPFGGDHEGRVAIMYLYGQLVHGTAGTLVREPEGFFVGGDSVAVLHRVTARRLGYSFDTRQCWVYRIADGLVAEVTVLSEDEFAEDAFWA